MRLEEALGEKLVRVALRGQELASGGKLEHSEHCSDQESGKMRRVAVAEV